MDLQQSGSERFNPDWVICPGETLREWLDENRLSASVLATICRLPVSTIAGILSGKRKLTKPVAAGLARGTMIPAQLWLNLERAYRDGLAAGKKDVSHL